MLLDSKYFNQLYGGWLGKIIGVIHGANVESWTYEKIKRVFGEIDSYPYTFKNFCADDDINGPVFYQRALLDYKASKTPSIEHMVTTIKNYVCDGHGFFWWGGYGVSTEHTAFENIKKGIKAPLSGSADLNGKTISEQIGGQIFSDCWGFLCPGDEELAASLAEKMSSITHDGEGVNGGKFIAACIAAAYLAEDVQSILQNALKQIAPESEYAIMLRDVIDIAYKNGSNWRKTFSYVKDKYGYQHYKGVCHIIPNAAIIALSLVHGNGNFDNTINICNMCGWDTDCNVGNVGSILGVHVGASKINQKWLGQVNDFFCASSSIGSLNIQTVSQVTEISARITHKLYGLEPIPDFKRIAKYKEGTLFHFEFPASTHSIRTRGTKSIIVNTDEIAYRGQRCLKITVPRITRGEYFDIYYKSYYVPEDFNDSRYDPDFSPTIYPGDTIKAWVKTDYILSGDVKVVPFWKDRISGDVHESNSESIMLHNDTWHDITINIPTLKNKIIEEIGFKLIMMSPRNSVEMPDLVLYVDEVQIIPNPNYEIELARLPIEEWNVLRNSPAHFTRAGGRSELIETGLVIAGTDFAEVYTGHIHWDNYVFKAKIKPLHGSYHSLLFRVQGLMRLYEVRLSNCETLSVVKRISGNDMLLKSIDFHHENGNVYDIEIEIFGEQISVSVDGKLQLELQDDDAPYLNGGIGFGNSSASVTSIYEYSIQSRKVEITNE